MSSPKREIDSMIETLNILLDPDMMEHIRTSEAQIARGEAIPIDEVESEGRTNDQDNL